MPSPEEERILSPAPRPAALPSSREKRLTPWTDHTVPLSALAQDSNLCTPALEPLPGSFLLPFGRAEEEAAVCYLPPPKSSSACLPEPPHSRCGLSTQTTSFSSPTKEVPLPLGEFLSWVSDVSKSWISSRGAPDSAAPRLYSSTQRCWMSIPTVLPAAEEPVPQCWGEVGQH
ncbi:hypothetical protein KIL84_010916 [Mauremys mutica]|uniref:Uncharacterized protein n=1 Tax=Mauremys mutica TaxID=74926 RepID=A0A9D3XB00_9SAUR|nr:hypothetical protein KIL84_010916 [Mauremys mutica]